MWMNFKRTGQGVWVVLLLMMLAGCRRETDGKIPEWTAAPTSEAAAVQTEEEAAEERIVIHVCGEVVSPGVYRLPAGSRVQDAVLAAGGMTAEAASDYLNLARLLEDGEKIVVPDRQEASSLAQAGDSGGGAETSPGKVNLNTAGLEELMGLPGIGEAKARAILDYRKTQGAFASVEDVMQVSGIGPAVFEKLREWIIV